MSHEQLGDVHTWECDVCGTQCEPEGDTFQEAWDEAKQDGWTAGRVNSEWVHRCPDCASLEPES